MSIQGGPIRTTPELFRDCLRLVNHVAGGRTSAKGAALRKIVASEFRKNAEVKDEQVIEALRGNAVRALCNYLMLQSLGKDDNLGAQIVRAVEVRIHGPCPKLNVQSVLFPR